MRRVAVESCTACRFIMPAAAVPARGLAGHTCDSCSRRCFFICTCFSFLSCDLLSCGCTAGAGPVAAALALPAPLAGRIRALLPSHLDDEAHSANTWWCQWLLKQDLLLLLLQLTCCCACCAPTLPTWHVPDCQLLNVYGSSGGMQAAWPPAWYSERPCAVHEAHPSPSSRSSSSCRLSASRSCQCCCCACCLLFRDWVSLCLRTRLEVFGMAAVGW